MEIKESEYEKLLGIKVDTKLNFNEHLNDIISKTSCKVNALSTVMPYISLSKKKYQWFFFLVTAPLIGCSIAIFWIINLFASTIWGKIVIF